MINDGAPIYYATLNFFIFLMFIKLAYDDWKDKEIFSYQLYITCGLFLLNHLFIEVSYFKEKLIFSLLIYGLYKCFKTFKNWVGEADLIIVLTILISTSDMYFLIFWFSHLILALIFGVIYMIRKKSRALPMFPIYLIGHIIAFIFAWRNICLR